VLAADTWMSRAGPHPDSDPHVTSVQRQPGWLPLSTPAGSDDPPALHSECFAPPTVSRLPCAVLLSAPSGRSVQHPVDHKARVQAKVAVKLTPRGDIKSHKPNGCAAHVRK
jgi:hypothetical protein